MRFLWIIFLFVLCRYSYTQNLLYKDSLILLRTKSLKAITDDSVNWYNAQFSKKLKNCLENKSRFNDVWDSLPYVSHLTNTSKNVHVFSWNILNNSIPQYYAVIAVLQKKDIITLELTDQKKAFTTSYMVKEVSPKDWLGAIYYDLIEVKHKKDFYYVLLGFNVQDALVNQKIIDVMQFKHGKWIFGKKIFEMPNKKMQSRIVFQYGKQVSMSVKYHEKRKQIIFDHLSPEENSKTGYYTFYGPDFTYDAFELTQEKKWKYIPNVEIFGDVNKPYNQKIDNKEKPLYTPKGK